jgi:hypothetical protein
MILFAAQGRSNDEIASALSVGRDVVSLWLERLFHERLPALDKRPRPGRPIWLASIRPVGPAPTIRTSVSMAPPMDADRNA